MKKALECARPSPSPPRLVFAPLAWLKLQMFLHAEEVEVGGFGLSSERDLLYVEDFLTVRQRVTVASVELADDAVADHFDRCVDQGLPPQRFGRIWCHTHPGQSPTPSYTDESTFQRVFGACDWSVMFILARGGQSYARLSFAAGPGGQLMLPVEVDWRGWPQLLADDPQQLVRCSELWIDEYLENVQPQAEAGLGFWEEPILAPAERQWLEEVMP